MTTRATKTKKRGRGRPPKPNPIQPLEEITPILEETVEQVNDVKEEVETIPKEEALPEDQIVENEDKGELVEVNDIPTETIEKENKEAPKEEKKKDEDKGPKDGGGKTKKNPTMREVFGYDDMGRIFDW